MKTLLQRMRGTVGMAVLWAGTWAMIGPFLALAIPGETTRWALPRLSQLLWTSFSCSFAGAIGGALFAALVTSNRGRHIDGFSARRVALQGAFAGVLVPAAGIALRAHGFAWALPILTQYAFMGAVWGVATFAIAKRRLPRLDSASCDVTPATSGQCS
jgi:hypothetical protein